MIDKSVAKRLGIQCGLFDSVIIAGEEYRDFSDEELYTFAQAVIEDFKDGFVPVGVVMNRRLFVSPSIDVARQSIKRNAEGVER